MNASNPRPLAIALLLVTLAACGSSDGSVSSNPDGRIESTTSINPATTTTSAWTPTTAPNPSTTLDLDAGLLPVPDGSFAIGVRAPSLPSALAFYPAVAGTGTGTRPYFDPRLLLASGLDETLFDRAVTFAEIGAQPEPASAARPVVIISSGFGSYLEFSTTLIERIASHGYVVVAVQPAVAAEAAVETPTEAMRDARLAQVTSALDYLDDPNFTELVGPVDLDRLALGGHSYAGSIAFNTALVDARVSAAFDLDGSLFDAAQTKSSQIPSLILSAMDGSAQDERIASLLSDAPNRLRSDSPERPTSTSPTCQLWQQIRTSPRSCRTAASARSGQPPPPRPPRSSSASSTPRSDGFLVYPRPPNSQSTFRMPTSIHSDSAANERRTATQASLCRRKPAITAPRSARDDQA